MIIGEFVDTFPPTLDGVGRVCLSYCETLNAMGHKAYYIAPRNTQCTQSYDVPFVLSYSIKLPREAYRIGLPLLDLKYQREIDRIQFDIVHAHSPFLAGEEALRIARERHVPLVTTFHSKYYDDILSKTHSKTISKTMIQSIVRFYNKCDAVWAVNHATADVLAGYGYRGKILVMENGTNIEALSETAVAELHQRVSPKPGVPVLLFVGQHNYKKNIHGILQACAILKSEGYPFHLITAGNGPDFQAIANEAKSLGIENSVTMLGFIDNRSLLMALYHEADLLVFPSIYDNAPMVLREAAVMETPGLVVAGSCSAEGIVDGDNGFISPDESAEAIAATIKRGILNHTQAGKRACETVPVPWSKIMRQVETEYDRLIQEVKDR